MVKPQRAIAAFSCGCFVTGCPPVRGVGGIPHRISTSSRSPSTQKVVRREREEEWH
jgi:hypothetical protein